MEKFTLKAASVFLFEVFQFNFIKMQLYQKESPTQVFSCEICEISKNTYFEEHLRTAAFVLHGNPCKISVSAPYPLNGQTQ